MSAPLYELTGNYNNLYELLYDEDIPVEVIEEGLSDIEDRIEVKFENTAKFIKSLDGDIAKFKEEEKRLATRRRTLENKQKSLKNYLLDQLTVMERTKVDANTFVVRRQANPPSAQIHDVSKLDEEYLIPQEPKVDTKKVLEDLKAEKAVGGATLKPKSYHLRIQ